MISNNEDQLYYETKICWLNKIALLWIILFFIIENSLKVYIKTVILSKCSFNIGKSKHDLLFFDLE